MLGQLHDVDLQQLRLFVSVVEAGGFSAAQGVLGLSQPTISQQMARLETRLGYRVCSRGKAGFGLTAKGEQLLLATRTLFASIEQFRQQSNGVAGRLLGEVRLGFSEALDPAVLQRLGRAIERFRRRDQSVRIELSSTMPADMERLLLEQRLDLAIGYFSLNQVAFDYRALFSEVQQLYCAPGHPLFEARGDLSELLLQADRVEHPYRFLQNREAQGIVLSSARSEQVDGTLAFILSGQHIGYLPRHIAEPWVARGLLRHIGGQTAVFEVPFYLAGRRGQAASEAQRAFEEDLLAVFA
ncbi:LysR family transcriptional regulator [Pseudomonas sp. HR96]|uniref:LysR family transcriptional regulator n=1 Tax=Pseudomonas sp. HR96 TaxID=1027966 RepID=UPI002A758CE3|nr:LysR family transcriptional regulator [Pseudomonas sp. HR96]WPP01267.1 LysR family transcriptional regulator [Pseudomonas sp. HR96]